MAQIALRGVKRSYRDEGFWVYGFVCLPFKCCGPRLTGLGFGLIRVGGFLRGGGFWAEP